MSKAEDRYLDYFLDGRLRNCGEKNAFIYGYHQAEKDLELTWEDIRLIDSLGIQYGAEHNEYAYKKEHYEEVLRRFNEEKGKAV